MNSRRKWNGLSCGCLCIVDNSGCSLQVSKPETEARGRGGEEGNNSRSYWDFLIHLVLIYYICRFSLGNISIAAILTHNDAVCFMCLMWSALLFPSEEGFCQSHNIQNNILVGIVDCLSCWIEHWGIFTQQLHEPVSSFKSPLSRRSLRSYTVYWWGVYFFSQ